MYCMNIVTFKENLKLTVLIHLLLEISMIHIVVLESVKIQKFNYSKISTTEEGLLNFRKKILVLLIIISMIFCQVSKFIPNNKEIKYKKDVLYFTNIAIMGDSVKNIVKIKSILFQEE